MAEIQKSSNMGEMTQRFIEFVMMQSQHAALFLGQIPNPQTGEATVNLEAARMFIDQLEMVREKTRGNLTSDEEKIINNALSNLQLAFLEVSRGGFGQGEEEIAEEPKIESTPVISTDTTISSNDKKRFSKSYGS
ncbi:MAG: DUF1844 domain-containing protein [Chthoniobacterales bacterium]